MKYFLYVYIVCWTVFKSNKIGIYVHEYVYTMYSVYIICTWVEKMSVIMYSVYIIVSALGFQVLDVDLWYVLWYDHGDILINVYSNVQHHQADNSALLGSINILSHLVIELPEVGIMTIIIVFVTS